MSRVVKIQLQQADSSDYTPDQESSISRFVNTNLDEDRNINEGKWTHDERLKFACFLLFYQSIFSSSRLRKQHRIFKKISLFLKSRKPRQCRSHYQKLTKRFKDFKELRKYFMKQYGREFFQKEYIKITSDFEDLPIISEQPQINTPVQRVRTHQVGVQTEQQPVFYALFWDQAQFMNYWMLMQANSGRQIFRMSPQQQVQKHQQQE